MKDREGVLWCFHCVVRNLESIFIIILIFNASVYGIAIKLKLLNVAGEMGYCVLTKSDFLCCHNDL